MNGSQLKCLRKSKNVRIRSYKFLLCILQRLFDGCSRLKSHSSCISRILSAAEIDCGSVHLRNVAAADHGEAVEWMERVAVTILSDILLIGCKVLAIAVHIRKCIHIVVLEHIVHLSKIRPQFIMEVSVAERSADNYTVIAHDSLMSDDLGGNSLKQHDRIGSHAFSVVEELRHTKYHHIVLFLCPRHIRSLVCHDPGVRLHYLCVSAVDLNLSGFRIQNRVTAEELLAHAFLHVLSDLIKLCSHQ